MNTINRTLAITNLTEGAKLYQPAHSISGDVSLNDPAINVMTDFAYQIPYSIGSDATIDDANGKMTACGIRLLFVKEKNNTLIGLITSTDTLGEKIVKHINEHRDARDDITVKDLMTPLPQLEGLYYAEVERATVGNIVETMKLLGRRHILVVEKEVTSSIEMVRGIFSTTQIGIQLGIEIIPVSRAQTIAELGNILNPSSH